MVRFYQSRSLRPLPGNPLPTAAALLLLVILASVAEAQPPVPQLDELHPCVGRGGSEFELRVTGANLDGAERLLFSHAQIVATQKTRPASEFVEFPGREPSVFLVRIPETVSGGTYSVRVAGRFGISNPRQFQVVQGELHHDSPATTFDNAPTALADHFYTARMNASAVHYFRYALQAGTSWKISVLCGRLDSQLTTRLSVLDADGREIHNATASARGDDLITAFTPDTDGDYTIALSDATYLGGDSYAYLLNVSSTPRVLWAYPPVVTASGATSLQLVTTDTPSSSLQLDLPDEPRSADWQPGSPAVCSQKCQRLQPPVDPLADVNVGVTDLPTVVEREPNNSGDQAETLPWPCEFTGAFQAPEDEDWISFSGAAGETIQLQFLGAAFGSPVDGTMRVEKVVKNEDGSVRTEHVATIDDVKHEHVSPLWQRGLASDQDPDPFYSLKLDQSATYRVRLRDTYHTARGDDRLVYRLVVRQPQPRFAVTVMPSVKQEDKKLIPIGRAARLGESLAVPVQVVRLDGFTRPVQLWIDGLPPGVECRPIVVPPHVERTELVITVAATAGAWAGNLHVRGTEWNGTFEVPTSTTPVDAEYLYLCRGTDNWEQSPPDVRHADGLAFAVVADENYPVSASMPTSETLAQATIGEAMPLDVHVARNTFTGPMEFKVVGVDENQISLQDNKIEGDSGTVKLTFPTERFKAGHQLVRLQAEIKAAHSRDPQAVHEIERRLAFVESIVTQRKQSRDQAEQAFAESDKQVTELKGKLDSTRSRHTAAEQSRNDQQQQAQAAWEAFQTTLNNSQADANALQAAQDALSTATSAAAAATTQWRQIDGELKPLEQQLAQIEQEQQQKKTVRDQAVAGHDRATQELERIKKSVEEIRKANQPAETTFVVHTPPISIMLRDPPATEKNEENAQ